MDTEKIFKEHPHLTLITTSVGERLQNSLGGKALVVPSLPEGTAPPDICTQHLQKKKIDTSDKKVARFFQSIVAVKMLRWWNK